VGTKGTLGKKTGNRGLSGEGRFTKGINGRENDPVRGLQRLTGKTALGSTGKGIGPVYKDLGRELQVGVKEKK